MDLIKSLSIAVWGSFLAVSLSSCATRSAGSSQPPLAENRVLTPDGKTISHSAPLLPGMSADPETPEEKAEVAEIAQKLDEQDLEIEEIFREGSAPSPTPDPLAQSGEGEDEDDDESDETFDAQQPRKKGSIPFEFNQRVAAWIQYFSQKDRERFQRFLDRGEPYREVVENILEENKVPVDLYYLGLIESGFVVSAKSHAKAVGVWQFMKATGKEYGLNFDSFVDERQDPVRATEAAAKYLRDLHRQFGSWYLAMAAYNGGPGRIRSAIRKAGTDDFWELVARKKLPQETMDYVPKFLAARYIGENPDTFAFYINEEKRFPNVELVRVPSPVAFEKIERVCGIPEGTLSFVNPHYLKNHTHPGRKYDQIWVPEKFASLVERKVSSLETARMKVKPTKATRGEREKVLVVRVKRGDTLKSIAKKQGLSVAYLKRVNGLKSSKIVPGQTLKLTASSYREVKQHPRKKRGAKSAVKAKEKRRG